MNMKQYALLILSFIGMSLFGQNIEITDQILEDLIVCDTGKVKYTFKSSFVDDLDKVEVQIALPQGVAYVAGSISGATELNIANRRVPIFEITKLSRGRKLDIVVDLVLNCESGDLVDMGVDFVDTLSVQHVNGNQTYRSSPHDILKPHLVLTTPIDRTINIAPYQKVERRYLVENNKQGRLKRFRFINEHTDCTVTSQDGKVITNTSTYLELELGPEDFKKIGNGDIYFDLDEELYITEEIIYEKDCETGKLFFDVTVDWGCDTEVCQDQNDQWEAKVNEKYGIANIKIEAQAVFPDCPCDIRDTMQWLTLTNIGNSVADAVTLELTARHLTFGNGNWEKEFWYEDQNGDSIPINIRSKDEFRCGQIYKEYVLELPNIEAGETIVVHWYSILCTSIGRARRHRLQNVEWKADIVYKDICSDLFRSGSSNWTGAPYQSFLMNSYKYPELIEHGDKYDFINVFAGDFLTQYQHGQFSLLYTIPCGFNFLKNEFKLGGVLPKYIDTISNRIIRVSYTLPLLDNVFIDTIYTQFDCNSPCIDTSDLLGLYFQETSCESQTGTFKARNRAIFCIKAVFSNCPMEDKYDICGFGDFRVTNFVDVFCDTGDTLLVVIPGYVDYSASLERTSIGLLDDDNDRIPDHPTKRASKDKINLKSVVENDTFRISIKGKVVGDIPNIKFDFLNVSYEFDTNLFKLIHNEIVIYDKSSGETYYCSSNKIDKDFSKMDSLVCGTTYRTRPPSRGKSLDFNTEYLKTRNCDIPSDFFYEDGDLIMVDMDFLFDRKGKGRYVNNTIKEIKSKVYIGSKDYNHYPVSCEEFKDTLLLKKLKFKYTSIERANIQACKPANADHYFKIIPNPGRENETNLFPFEVRNFIYLENFKVSFDQAVTVDSFVIKYFYKDSFPHFNILISKINVPALKVDDTTWTFDHSLSESFDDGYEIIIEPYISVKDCHDLVNGLTIKKENAVCTTTAVKPYHFFDFDDAFIRPKNKQYFKKIKTKGHRLFEFFQLKVNFFNHSLHNQSFDDKGRWLADVTLDDSLKYFKFKIINKDAGLSNVRIVDNFGNVYKENNNELIITNYYPHKIDALTLIADNNSCELQHLDVISAWACDSVGDIFDMACAIDTFHLTVKSDTPRLDLAVRLVDSPYKLCDTVNYIEIEITNADKGAAFDLVLDMMTADGFTLLDKEILYTLDNSMTFNKMSSPILINPNHYQWNLTNDVQEFVADGFPGEGSTEHIIRIRIIGTLNCEFDPGEIFIFEIKAQNNCGIPTNSLKITEPIKIDGVSTNNNSLNIVATASPEVFFCSENSVINVLYNSTENFGTDDEINIALPLGISYVGGSIKEISNFNLTPPIVSFVNGAQILKWNVKDVSVGKSDISFEFEIIADLKSLDCALHLLDVKISRESNVLCKTSGDSCFVNIVAGMVSIPLKVEKGEVDIIEVLEFERLNDSTIHVCFNMSGDLDTLSEWTESLTFDLFVDINNDDKTSDDTLISTVTNVIVFKVGDTTKVCLDFKHKKINPSCHFIIDLNNNQNCICDGTTLKFDGLLEGGTKDYTLCPSEEISIGTIFKKGTMYQWLGADLPCDDCPSFKIVNDFDRDTIFTRRYELTVSDSLDCEYKWIYNITFLPVLDLELLDIDLCLGDSVIVSIEGVQKVVWTSGDVNVTTNPAIFHPNESGLYVVQYIDLNNCEGTDSIKLNVSYVDTSLYEISNDTTIEIDGQAQLWIEGEGNMEWSPNATLDCTDCRNPIATPKVTTIYTVTITDKNGCRALLNVTVIVFSPPCDPVNVFVPNAFSPNGDNNNDELLIRGNYIDEIHFMIYNRWGQKVFETRDITIPWLGEYKNSILSPDVFSYYLKVKCLDGEYFVKKGNVSILR